MRRQCVMPAPADPVDLNAMGVIGVDAVIAIVARGGRSRIMPNATAEPRPTWRPGGLDPLSRRRRDRTHT